MSQQDKQKMGFLGEIITTILGACIAAPIIALTFIAIALFFPLRQPLSRLLDLERRSASWSSMAWLYRPLLWVSGFLFMTFLAGLIIFTYQFFTFQLDIRELIRNIPDLLLGLAAGPVFASLLWMEDYADDPDVQKKMAGIAAERHVQSLIDICQRTLSDSIALHGQLFVFHPHASNEFSVEIDHILVTRRNIFVIETKYKSGTIQADAKTPKWQVSTDHGVDKMRNALLQVKNTIRVLQQQVSLPCEAIPLVVFVGDATVVGGPTNVMASADLAKIVHAFEHMQDVRISDPAAVVALLSRHVSSDKVAMERHIKRAQAARDRTERAEIVEAASIR